MWVALATTSALQVLALRGHSGLIRGAVFSRDGAQLASASQDGTLRLWHAPPADEALTLRNGFRANANCLFFSPVGARLATHGSGVQLWNAVTGREVFRLSGLSGVITKGASLSFSPNAQRLATAHDNNTADIWDADTGGHVVSLKGHTNTVTGVAFSSDGTRLATSSLDKTVKIWDPETGREILILQGHTDAVYSVAFRPDGKRHVLAGCNLDNANAASRNLEPVHSRSATALP